MFGSTGRRQNTYYTPNYYNVAGGYKPSLVEYAPEPYCPIDDQYQPLDLTPEPIEINNDVEHTTHRFKKEGMCCKIMEDLYGVKFNTHRPDFLRGNKGRNLELDCFNPELRLAVEYNGEQHYKWPNFTNQTREQFEEQIARDQFKLDACDANGVYLITVPYTVPENKLREYIIHYLPENQLKRLQAGQQF